MEGNNHTGRGKGRSVFGQVAKGLGFISEHKATHGRYLMLGIFNSLTLKHDGHKYCLRYYD